jgi:hypothetical protein
MSVTVLTATDGRLILPSNDGTPNALLFNDGKGHFTDHGVHSGVLSTRWARLPARWQHHWRLQRRWIRYIRNPSRLRVTYLGSLQGYEDAMAGSSPGQLPSLSAGAAASWT